MDEFNLPVSIRDKPALTWDKEDKLTWAYWVLHRKTLRNEDTAELVAKIERLERALKTTQ